jgi:hypothetical protein
VSLSKEGEYSKMNRVLKNEQSNLLMLDHRYSQDEEVLPQKPLALIVVKLRNPLTSAYCLMTSCDFGLERSLFHRVNFIKGRVLHGGP